MAQAYDSDEGATPLRWGPRTLLAAGRFPPGPVEIFIPPTAVALERPPKRPARSSVRNRLPVLVESVHPVADGVYRVDLQAAQLRFSANVVRGALRSLRIRPGAKLHALIKAVSVDVAPRLAP